MWPALPSFTIAALTHITKNILVSFFILELSSICLLVYSFFKVLIQDSVKTWLRVLFLFVCFSPAFITRVQSIDLLSLSLAMYSVYLFTKNRDIEKHTVTFALLLSGILALCCLVRFNYYAIAFAPSMVYFLFWLKEKKTNYIKLGVWSAVFPILIIVGQSWFISTMSADIAYIEDKKLSIYWSNLTLVKPVFTTLLFNIESESISKIPLLAQLDLSPKTMKHTINMLLIIIEFTVLLWIVFHVRLQLFKDAVSLYITLLSAFTIGSLYVLSLVVEPLTLNSGDLWTFTSNARYFALALLCVLMLIARNQSSLPRLGKVSLIFLNCLLVFPSVRTHYYHIKANRYNLNFDSYALWDTNYKPIDEADYYVTNNYAYFMGYATMGYKTITYDELEQFIPKTNTIQANKKEKVKFSVIQLRQEEFSRIKPTIETNSRKFEFSIVEL